MTEMQKIKKSLAREGRSAYKQAKIKDNAYIVVGNNIYRVLADGSRKKVKELSKTRVKAHQKQYVI
ncbi:MAG: hypothetical protein IKK40_01680 [Bacteroidales bacterium]|nr:hypothetical protein [Bacteroidales bacterium]